MQKVYVNKLKREVEFSIENSTQDNEVIKMHTQKQP